MYIYQVGKKNINLKTLYDNILIYSNHQIITNIKHKLKLLETYPHDDNITFLHILEVIDQSNKNPQRPIRFILEE